MIRIADEMEIDIKGNVIWMELVLILTEMAVAIYMELETNSKLIQVNHLL